MNRQVDVCPHCGRPPIGRPVEWTEERIEKLRPLYADNSLTVRSVARQFNASPSQVSRLAKLSNWPLRGNRGGRRIHKWHGARLTAAKQAYLHDKRKLDAVGYDIGTSASQLCHLAKIHKWPRRAGRVVTS